MILLFLTVAKETAIGSPYCNIMIIDVYTFVNFCDFDKQSDDKVIKHNIKFLNLTWLSAWFVLILCQMNK